MVLIKGRFFIVLTIGLLALVQPKLLGQSTYSTYSIVGVGDYIDPAVPAAMGMAGLGISNGSYWYINNTNPALLYFNRFAMFSLGVLAETKTVNQAGYEPYRAGSGNLYHLSLAFPIKREKWSFSLALQPYTAVNYSFFYDGTTTNNPDQTIILNEGDGGITALNFSAGGLVFKNLSVGFKASYLFSSYDKEYSSIVSADLPSYIATYLLRQSVSGFAIGTGIAYQQKLGEYNLGLGVIYDLQTDIDGKISASLEQRNLSNSIIYTDTLRDNADNVLSLPSTLGVGISFGKPNNWMVGFDYKIQDWTSLKVNDDPSARPDAFAIGKKYILGAEFTADPLDVRSYLKRITFRVGGSYEELPYVISNTKIQEFGINFGWTLPVARFSSLDFGLRMGQRGTTDNNLVREDFFKVYFGATFNDNRWFIRPKFN